MTRLLNDFEKLTGKKISELTIKDFTEIANNKKYSDFFEDNKLEILVDLLEEENLDEYLKKSIWEIYLNILYKMDTKIVANRLDEHTEGKITNEEFNNKLKELFNSEDDPIIPLMIFITVGSLGIKMEFARDTVLQNISKLEYYFSKLTTGSILSFSTRNDFLTLLYNVKVESKYAFNDDNILKDFQWISEAQEEFDIEMSELVDALPEAEVSPEMLGLIDITKLKNKTSLREEVIRKENEND